MLGAPGDETILPGAWLANTSVTKAVATKAPARGSVSVPGSGGAARPARQTSVIEFCSSAMLLEKFQESNAQLEDIQRRLSVFLQTKRVVFPRFYFLSDDELLQVCVRTVLLEKN